MITDTAALDTALPGSCSLLDTALACDPALTLLPTGADAIPALIIIVSTALAFGLILDALLGWSNRDPS